MLIYSDLYAGGLGGDTGRELGFALLASPVPQNRRLCAGGSEGITGRGGCRGRGKLLRLGGRGSQELFGFEGGTRCRPRGLNLVEEDFRVVLCLLESRRRSDRFDTRVICRTVINHTSIRIRLRLLRLECEKVGVFLGAELTPQLLKFDAADTDFLRLKHISICLRVLIFYFLPHIRR